MKNEATETLERLLAESYPAAFDVLTDPDLRIDLRAEIDTLLRATANQYHEQAALLSAWTTLGTKLREGVSRVQ